MVFRKMAYTSLLSLPFFLIIFFAPGCAKEYSHEGRDTMLAQDTTTMPDTMNKPVIAFPVCAVCLGTDTMQIAENRWSFKYENAYVCGIIDTAILTPERNGFTFFGPSACSLDSGLIITAFFGPSVLDSDKRNFTINNVSFEYYDNVKPSDIFVTRNIKQLSLTIDTYTHSTRLATGTFQGYVYTEDGHEAFIYLGKFKVKLI